MIAEPLLMALKKCIGDALVNEGAEAPKPHLPLVEVRILTSTAGGLLPAGTASSAMRTIFLPTPLLKSLSDQEKNQPDKFQPVFPSLLGEEHRNKIK